MSGSSPSRASAGEMASCAARASAEASEQEAEGKARSFLWFAGMRELMAELYARSDGQRYGMTEAQFAEILGEIARKYLRADADARAGRALLMSLRVEELALARACASGSEKAWECFLLRYREKLYDAGRAIARDDATGRELADALYADLYGTKVRSGERVSKLASYTGRGSLEGWLRTVLAQEFVNCYRRQRRLVSLEEKEEEQGAQFAAPAQEAAGHVDPRLEAATAEALGALSAEERFILSAYFLDGSTLAQIARLLHVHESTISRRVEKIAAAVRKRVRSGLEARGMSRAQAEEAMEADVRDLSIDVRAHLKAATRMVPAAGDGGSATQEMPAAAFSGEHKPAGTGISAANTQDSGADTRRRL